MATVSLGSLVAAPQVLAGASFRQARAIEARGGTVTRRDGDLAWVSLGVGEALLFSAAAG